MKRNWTTCIECGETLYADTNGEFFCNYCDGYDPESDIDCWLDDEESSFIGALSDDFVADRN